MHRSLSIVRLVFEFVQRRTLSGAVSSLVLFLSPDQLLNFFWCQTLWIDFEGLAHLDVTTPDICISCVSEFHYCNCILLDWGLLMLKRSEWGPFHVGCIFFDFHGLFIILLLTLCCFFRILQRLRRCGSLACPSQSPPPATAAGGVLVPHQPCC